MSIDRRLECSINGSRPYSDLNPNHWEYIQTIGCATDAQGHAEQIHCAWYSKLGSRIGRIGKKRHIGKGLARTADEPRLIHQTLEPRATPSYAGLTRSDWCCVASMCRTQVLEVEDRASVCER